MIKVYQNQSTYNHHDEINELGWSGAMKKHEGVKAHLETASDGSENWKPEWFKHYSHVADLDTNSRDEAFSLMNAWHDPRQSYEVERIQTHAKCHSMSVGDILEDEDGTFYMVEPAGFDVIKTA